MNLVDICAVFKEPIPHPEPVYSTHSNATVECAAEVLEHVQKLRHSYEYKLRLLDVDLTITFYTLTPKTPSSEIDRVLRILHFLLPHRKCRMTKAVFHIYSCQHLKVLPSSGPLGPAHVNTGYAYRCSHMVVYREEEWAKVFIHECMHYFNMDADLKIVPEIQAAFHSVTKIELCESYCEMWARLLHCCLVSVLCKEELGELLRVEQDFAYFQTAKVLDYAGTTYQEVVQGKTRNYKENTNVFAYYAVTCALLHSFHRFPLTFTNPPQVFVNFVLESYKVPSLFQKLKEAEQKVALEKRGRTRLYKTTRMTITDLCLD
jgi:hypothetical protein